MKKKIVFLLLTVASISLYVKAGEPTKVDPRIEDRFRTEHKQSLDVSWEIVEDVSIATFVENEERKQVYYLSDGSVMAFGKFIDISQLPETVNQSLAKWLDGANVLEVYELQTSTSPTKYFVRLITKRRQLIISANQFGIVEILDRKRVKRLSN